MAYDNGGGHSAAPRDAHTSEIYCAVACGFAQLLNPPHDSNQLNWQDFHLHKERTGHVSY